MAVYYGKMAAKGFNPVTNLQYGEPITLYATFTYATFTNYTDASHVIAMCKIPAGYRVIRAVAYNNQCGTTSGTTSFTLGTIMADTDGYIDDYTTGMYMTGTVHAGSIMVGASEYYCASLTTVNWGRQLVVRDTDVGFVSGSDAIFGNFMAASTGQHYPHPFVQGSISLCGWAGTEGYVIYQCDGAGSLYGGTGFLGVKVDMVPIPDPEPF